MKDECRIYPLPVRAELPLQLSQALTETFHAAGLSDKAIATIVNCREETITLVRTRQSSGARLEDGLMSLFELMQDTGALQ